MPLSLCLAVVESQSFAQTPSLAEAVDATNLVWTTGGNGNWFGQTIFSFNGADAAQAPDILTNQVTWIQTIITNGPGTLHFFWKIKACNNDYLRYYLNGQLQYQIAGDTDWQYCTNTILGGAQTNEWLYVTGTHVGSCFTPQYALLDEVIFRPPLSLAQAVETCGAAWTSGGNANSTKWEAQTVVTHDGIDAAESGIITHGQESWMATTVGGVTNVSFWWKVSSEGSVKSNFWYDVLSFHIDDTNTFVDRISGEIDWTNRSFQVPSGTHTLYWRYAKDSDGTAGQDKGWVDQITFKPPLTNAAPPFSLSSPTILTNRNVQLTLLMDEDCSCRILYSTNLSSSNWITLTNVPATNANKQLTDLTATNSPQRFYRGVSP